MARRRSDVDWYVVMSERLERREARRKWIILGVCVGLGLLIILGGSAYIYIDRNDLWPNWLSWLRRPAAPATLRGGTTKKSEPLEPLIATSLQDEDYRYSQLDGSGFPTTITHYFREFPYEHPPKVQGGESQSGFKVNRTDPATGTVERYRLRNIGTGDQYEIRDVPVKRVAEAEWIITEQGHLKIRKALQAKMKVEMRRVEPR